MKLGIILNVVPILNLISDSDEIYGVASFKLVTNIELVNDEASKFEKARIATAEKFSSGMNEDNTQYIFADQEARNNYNQAVNDILNQDIEITFQPLNPLDLAKVKIKPSMMMVLKSSGLVVDPTTAN